MEKEDKDAILFRIDSIERLLSERIEHLEQILNERIETQEKVNAISFASSKDAVQKAETAQQAYNVRSNEFRDALNDANKANLSRLEAEARFKIYDEKIDDLKELINQLFVSRGSEEGKHKGTSATWGYVIAAIGMVTAIVSLLINSIGG